MPTYDIAVGINQPGLDQVASGLYAVPYARQHLFKGSISKPVPPLGNVVLDYDIGLAPTFVLMPPSAAQWAAAEKITPTQPLPTDNAFQLTFPLISGSVTIGTSPPLVASGALVVYGELLVAAGNAAMVAEAVYIDESSFSGWDKIIVNAILIPQALKIATQLLSFSVPPIPTFAGLTFQPVVAEIENNCVFVGTTLVGGGTTDLDNMPAPLDNIFAIIKLNPINKALVNEVNGNTYKEEDKVGPDAWYAAGNVTATDVQLSVSLDGTDLDVAVNGSFSGYGELGGVGVGIAKAVLCPVAAAVDAIASPGNWDKVIASFNILYKPHPLIVPVTIVADVPDPNNPGTGQPVKLSIGQLSSVQLIYEPTWSGSVTGSVLSTAAAAFIDLVMSIFSKLIVNDLLKKHGQNHTVYTLPPLVQTMDGVTASLSISTAAITYIGPDALAQGVTIAFS